eukprot:NODE_25746_length_576_cov_4.075724.p4 GENE.NODE_25746_length_576_cov_4.075724~~NODE_25746_length_576_cov_4.075724.p4  ORF type:complete len:59 (-),score=9.75 NODE_25746_length_576_cov_4.075724:22-198(-)
MMVAALGHTATPPTRTSRSHASERINLNHGGKGKHCGARIADIVAAPETRSHASEIHI